MFNEETKKWDYADGTPSLTNMEAVGIAQSYKRNPQKVMANRPEYFITA